jgi:gluconate 2-dehydrogenase subunit 3-like protein
MLRRTLLQLLAALVVVRPIRVLARVLQPPPFKPLEIETLTAVADVVLPSDLGADGRRRAVDRFVSWFVNYRDGADMGHGYGASTLRPLSGPSPALRYPEQFAALDAAARDRGVAMFTALAPDARREVIERLLNEPRPVNRLPPQPTGANLIADFMGSYFTSADAQDHCYRVQIGRDSCRTLDDSADQPRTQEGR